MNFKSSFLIILGIFCFMEPGFNSTVVLSFNIRYDNPNDGENAWPNRKEKVANTILFHDADIIGMQEVLKHQLEDLEKLLPKNYAWQGVGRTDGKEAGEYAPIFYNRDKLTKQESETFWLSENPDEIGSRGWDAALPRIVTWIKFKDKKSGKEFFVFNTHFDHRGDKARAESAKLIIEKINEIANGLPTILTGDFNVEPSSRPYQLLAKEMTDIRTISKLPYVGSKGTFNGFDNPSNEWRAIDFIFIKGKITVLKAATLSTSWNGLYASDHFPIYAKIELVD